MKHWIHAARLRTLPLAFSCILVGSGCAYMVGAFSWSVFISCLFTTLCLQVLSNYANDFGDAEKGTDDETRIGPKRAIQSGLITKEAMKKAMITLSIITFLSGVFLLYLSKLPILPVLLFIVLGLSAIAAAIKYTAGKNAYGYKGLGDLFVFLFFGIVGILGSFYLYVHQVDFMVLLPAAAIGFLSTAVLHLNNMRDIAGDKLHNKITIAVRLGSEKSKYYFLFLLVSAVACFLFFTTQKVQLTYWDYLYLLPSFVFIKLIKKVFTTENPRDLDPLLKVQALTTFGISLLFFISQFILVP